MPFTRAQQPAFRQLVARAATACSIPSDSAARRPWYEAELMAATGHASTRECNRTTDYDAAMAHFEALVGDDITWQLRAAHGGRVRIMHGIDRALRRLDLPPAYADAIAVQALGLSPLPPLDSLDERQLLTILRALKIHAARTTNTHTTAAA